MNKLLEILNSPYYLDPMKPGAIISRKEALKILENDLRRAALLKHAPDLESATPERRAEIRAQIEQEINRQLRQRKLWFGEESLLH